MHPELSEAERFPMLTQAGRRLLHALREDPRAPIWNWPNGEQLDITGLHTVREFDRSLRNRPVASPGALPDWIRRFVDFCLEDVPFYRGRSRPGTPLHAIPSCSRDDLAPRVWEFVPDSQPLDALIVFSSSGTTGHPARLPTHPATAACGIPLLEHILGARGIAFPRGPERMALTNVAAYEGAYTTAIVISFLDEAGCIRVNLRPGDWRSPDHSVAYLNHWHAPVFLGDPIAFAELRRLRLERPPEVLVSSILTLTDGFAAELEREFGCPVLDVYALTEAGIVAVRVPEGHAIVPPDLYVEILDEFDEVCPMGVRGEITLSGGRNPFTPLLRYRTGDFAALGFHAGRPTLLGLEGRTPVLFPTPDGRLVHGMEVSRLLRRFPLVQFRLHQDEQGGFTFGYRGAIDVDQVTTALTELLGHPRRLTIEEIATTPRDGRKIVEYRSALRVPGFPGTGETP
jgi:phenylacetate-CoA ligase